MPSTILRMTIQYCGPTTVGGACDQGSLYMYMFVHGSGCTMYMCVRAFFLQCFFFLLSISYRSGLLNSHCQLIIFPPLPHLPLSPSLSLSLSLPSLFHSPDQEVSLCLPSTLCRGAARPRPSLHQYISEGTEGSKPAHPSQCPSRLVQYPCPYHCPHHDACYQRGRLLCNTERVSIVLFTAP